MRHRDPHILELEAATHRGYDVWGQKMVDDSQDGTSVLMPYDGRRSQRINEGAYEPPLYPWIKLPFIPNRLVLRRIKQEMGKVMGSAQLADDMVAAFAETSAYGGELSVADAVWQKIQARKTVAVISDHLIPGDYTDPALNLGGLIVATGKKAAREHTALVVGLNMSRMGKKNSKGKVEEMTRKIRKGLGVIYVMQNTGTRDLMPIPEEADQIANEAGGEAMKELGKKGSILGIVPSGTAVGRETIDYYAALPQLWRKNVGPAIGSLLLAEAIVTVAYNGHEVRVSPLFSVAGSEGNRKERFGMIHEALGYLARQEADLMQLPVRYQDITRRVRGNKEEPFEYDIAYPEAA